MADVTRVLALAAIASFSTVVFAGFTPVAAQQGATLQTKEILYSGRVGDEAGRPLPGVTIELSSLQRDAGSALPTTTTDDKGCFRIPVQRVSSRDSVVRFVLRKRGRATQQVRVRLGGLDIGMLTMLRGVTITGLVRDANNKPLAGVRVTATDMMSRIQSVFFGADSGRVTHETTAITDEFGRYRLRNALSNGLDIEFTKTGFYSTKLFGVSLGDPLTTTLTPASKIRGQVTDKEGRPVPGALVAIVYLCNERYAAPSDKKATTITGREGRFELWRTLPGGYQVYAQIEDGQGRALTDQLYVDHQDLRLVVGKVRGGRTTTGEMDPFPRLIKTTIRVRAADQKTRKPVGSFRAALLSLAREQLQYQEPWFLENAFAATSVASRDGIARLSGLRDSGSRLLVVVKAAGYATSLTEVMPDGAEGEARAELAPESVLAGRVVDHTGKAVMDASVLVVSHVEGRVPDLKEAGKWLAENHHGKHPHVGVRTDKEGRFYIGGLAAGNHDVFVYAPTFVVSTPKTVELTTGQTKRGLRLITSRGSSLRVEMAGGKVHPRWRMQLTSATRADTRVWGGHWSEELSGQRTVGDDGVVTFDRLRQGEHVLQLLLPTSPRLGHPAIMRLQRVEIEGIAGRKRVPVDLRKTGPVLLRGKVRLTGAAIPYHRLVVAAEPVGSENRDFTTNFLELRGARAFVGRDGSFELSVPPYPCKILLMDPQSFVVFVVSDKINPGQSSDDGVVELTAQLVKVRVQLSYDDPRIYPRRIEVRLGSTWPGDVGDVCSRYEGPHDTRVGVPLSPGQRHTQLVLPSTPLELWVRGSPKLSGNVIEGDVVLAKHRWAGEPGKLEIKLRRTAK